MRDSGGGRDTPKNHVPTGTEADGIIAGLRKRGLLPDLAEVATPKADQVHEQKPSDTSDRLSPFDQPPDQQQRDSGDSGDTPTPGRPRAAWTAAELLAEDFPEPKWAVPGILPEGCILLAGPPKVGKSWMTLGLGLSVASGGKALGKIDVPAGPVLYLALEDTPRRLRSRLAKMLAGDPAPTAMTLVTTCPPLREGGDKRIAMWLDRHPDARLVVVDVFTRMRGSTHPGANAYQADYAAVAQMKAVADAYGVAMVLVVHVRKAQAEDFLEDISGTNGLAGAADAVAVLRRSRGKADGALQVTGRDVDEATYALAFGADLGTWQLLEGPATNHLVGDTRATILAAVRQTAGTRPRQLADVTCLDYDLVKQTVRRMVDAGQLDTDGNGRYFLPVTAVSGDPPVTGVTGVSPTTHGASHEPMSAAVPPSPAVGVGRLCTRGDGRHQPRASLSVRGRPSPHDARVRAAHPPVEAG